MEQELKALFAEVERHVMPLVSPETGSRFSKDESRVLALQGIHRLNQRIGFLVRSDSSEIGEMRLLQTYVNNLTIGVKNDNPAVMRASLNSVRNIITAIAKSEK